jgi:hypothetical protein
VLGATDRQPGQAVVVAAADGADAVAELLRAGGRTTSERAMTGPMELEGPDGKALTLQRLPGRGWRCCSAEDTPHYLVAAQPSLRDALTEALPGLAEDDPWLVGTLQRLAPEELGG